MIFRAAIPILFVLLLFSCGQSTVNNEHVVKDTVKTKPVNTDSSRKGVQYVPVMVTIEKSAYDSFQVRIGDSIYRSNYKGYFTSSDTTLKTSHFLFDLKAEYLIDRIYMRPVDNDQFFVCWQETDHLGIYSYYAIFDRGNNKPVWIASVNAPSPGPPIIDSDFVYVSSLGMIAKYNRYTGEKAWRLDSLFDPFKLTYKQFERPLLFTNTVCFYDLPIKGKKERRDSIWLDDASGKIVR